LKLAAGTKAQLSKSGSVPEGAEPLYFWCRAVLQ